MLTRQQLPSLVVLLATWLSAISLSMPWLEGEVEPTHEGWDPTPVEVGGDWLATEEVGPVVLAVLVLVGTVVVVVLGTLAAGTSISWMGITLTGLSLALVFILSTAIDGLEGNPAALAGFYLWRGALVVAAIGGIWHSFVTDDLLRNTPAEKSPS